MGKCLVRVVRSFIMNKKSDNIKLLVFIHSACPYSLECSQHSNKLLKLWAITGLLFMATSCHQFHSHNAPPQKFYVYGFLGPRPLPLDNLNSSSTQARYCNTLMVIIFPLWEYDWTFVRRWLLSKYMLNDILYNPRVLVQCLYISETRGSIEFLYGFLGKYTIY